MTRSLTSDPANPARQGGGCWLLPPPPSRAGFTQGGFHVAHLLRTRTHARTHTLCPIGRADRREALAGEGARRDEGPRPGEVHRGEEGTARSEAAHQRERADHRHLPAAEGQ